MAPEQLQARNNPEIDQEESLFVDYVLTIISIRFICGGLEEPVAANVFFLSAKNSARRFVPGDPGFPVFPSAFLGFPAHILLSHFMRSHHWSFPFFSSDWIRIFRRYFNNFMAMVVVLSYSIE